jgi:hypothetical protein
VVGRRARSIGLPRYWGYYQRSGLNEFAAAARLKNFTSEFTIHADAHQAFDEGRRAVIDNTVVNAAKG